MKKLLTVGLVSAFLSALLASMVVASAAAALPKPKPWQWTPQKASIRLTAADPFVFSDIRLESSECTGTGKAVAGRYSRFQCKITTSAFWTLVLIKVLPVGSGKLCVMTYPDGRTIHPLTTKGGMPVVPERACPTA